MEGKSADFAEGPLYAFEQLRMTVDQIGHPVSPAALFVADKQKAQIEGKFQSLFRCSKGQSDEHGYFAFHIDSASSPYISVFNLCAKRIAGPLLVCHWHDVYVTVEEKGRFSALRILL